MSKKVKLSELRIIAGQWRRRKIAFIPEPGLRPTSDRLRETLFNWLAPYIQCSNCLDLFAGSGALGFEALSRGASHVSFVDSNSKIVEQLKNTASLLEAEKDSYEICKSDVFAYSLNLSFRPYDIIFLDPPFSNLRLPELFAWLEESECLKSDTLVYLEKPKTETLPSLPNWECVKSGATSTITYALFRFIK